VNRATLRHGAVFAGIFGFVGVSLPFWPTLLASRGLSASTIGILLAIGPWLRFAINPRVGALSDTRWGTRNVFVGFAALLLAGGLLLLASGAAISLLIASAIVMAVGFSPLASLADASTLVHARDGYARARLWGSVAFIACSLGLGYWLETHAVESIATSIALASIIVVLTGALLPNTRKRQAQTAPPTPETITSPPPMPPEAITSPPPMPPEAITSPPPMPPLLGVCLLAGLLNSSHAILYGFGTLHWRSLGISNGHIGILWTIGVLAEIAVFVCVDRLKQGASARWLLWIACLGGLVRWCLLAFTTTFASQVVAQFLHGATFACAHLGILRRLSQIVPNERITSAVTKVAGIGGGLAMGLGSLIAGVAYERFASQSFMIAAAASLAACAVLWSFSRPPHKPRNASGSSQLLT
jgi:PPP family 3-phenylpropionic acid transporter